MAFLKKFWPYSFTVKAKDVTSLVVNIIIQILVAFAAGLLIWLATAITGWIPVVGGLIGVLLGIVGSVIEIYVLIGIVLSVLNFCDVLKD
ncbi:MAG: hypothetical protein IKK06_00355 [Clostridia bacterium]|nr:hypothetical protein [Clostridia bacterium]